MPLENISKDKGEIAFNLLSLNTGNLFQKFLFPFSTISKLQRVLNSAEYNLSAFPEKTKKDLLFYDSCSKFLNIVYPKKMKSLNRKYNYLKYLVSFNEQ